jgi:hypothetical protein
VPRQAACSATDLTSRGILEAEMAITTETIDVTLEHMAAEPPGQMAGLDDFLNQPA